MAKREIDMTRGALPGQIFRFSLPLMLSNVLQVLFNMSDVAVVGRFAGPEALGSVGSTTILVSLYTGFAMGLGNGVNVHVARYLGARNHKAARETVQTSALLCLGMGLLLLLLGVGLARPFLVLLGTKDTLIDGAEQYLKIYFLGMPALALYNYGNAVYSAAGNTRRPLACLSAAGVLNIALNLLFVIVFQMDVAGVALASVISQYLTAALVLFFLSRPGEESWRLRPGFDCFSLQKAKSVLALGLPSGFQNAVFAIANLFIQSGVNTLDAVVVEGNSAAGNSDPLVYDMMAAFYVACSSFMSQNYGAGKKSRVRSSYFICLVYSFGVALILGLLLVAFGPQFLSLFTADEAVIQAGMGRLRIMAFSYCVSAFMDNTIAASRGLGKTLVPTLIVIMGSCVFRVIWVYTVFRWFGTLTSLYLLYVFSWTLTSIAEIVYFVRIYRKQLASLPEE